MKAINVMHVTYDMRIGGTEMVIKNIIENVTDQPVTMSIFCIESPIGPWGQKLQSSGVAITCNARKPGFDLRLIFTIRAHIKAHNIDVIHCHQYTPWVYGALAAFGLGKKVIFTEHGRFYPDTSSWKRRFINPILVKITSSITAISAATKQALAEYEFIPKSAISVVYNGIQLNNKNKTDKASVRSRLNLKPDDLVFGTIARFDPIKNQVLMINAFKTVNVNFPKSKLLMIGDGEMKQALVALVAKLNLQDSVIFTGYLSYPLNYLAAMDVFLLSSLSEGTSMTLLEAMALGKPCVVTDAGGNREIIINEENGLVTANENAELFSQAMQTLAIDSALLQKMGDAARVRFITHFTAKRMNQKYYLLYEA
ncbi:MAG: glycosyltransferase involved in cell wall biosynthesis [Colwellia sp.]